MRSICFVLVLVALASTSYAKDISIKFDDGQQQAIVNLQGLEDKCVVDVLMRGDPSVCRNVSAFLGAMAAAVRQAQADQAVADNKAAADKAVADKAAADAAAKANVDAKTKAKPDSGNADQ